MTIQYKRMWPVMLFAVAVFALTVLFGEKNDVFADFSSCGASVDDPCSITTKAQLKEIGEDGNLGKHFELNADLDLAGENWIPIGTFFSSHEFTGSFEGNGHTIANLTIDTEGSGTNYLGLFGAISDGAVIRNIGLINVSIDEGDGDGQYIGGLVGYSVDSTIGNTYVTGSISTAGTIVGGLAGYALNGSVDYSYAAVTVSDVADSGGLIGKSQGGASIDHSYYNIELATGSDGGVALTTAQMKESGSFTGWFPGGDEESWAIIEGVTYPMHRTTFDRIALDTLEVEDADGPVALEPAFSSERFAYTGVVPNDMETATVSAYAQGSASSIEERSDTESVPLAEGENTIAIKVSSSDVAVPVPLNETANPFVVAYTLTIVREDGSEDHPHSITSAEQLAAIGTGHYEWGDSYKLMNDIDLSGYHGGDGWDPIGDGDVFFTGAFNGNGHVIRNLFINRSDEEYVGLFAVLGGAVNDLGLLNVDVAGDDHVGGLAGEINNGTIARSYATGTVTGTGERAGGLAGSFLSGAVTDSYSTADVEGDADVGGLIGYLSGGSVTGSYAAGEVVGNTAVGGLVGFSENNLVTDSFWDVKKSGQDASAGGSGAAGKETSEMQTRLTFQDAGWDFATTWAMMDGTSYPMFLSDFEAVKLAGIQVTASEDVLDWDPGTFDPEQGAYTIVSGRYITSVDVSASPADPSSTVTVAGSEDAPVTVPVSPGNHAIEIETADKNGIAQGLYKLTIQVPAPGMTDDVQIPSDGYYGTGDTLTFTVSYEGDVDVAGTPRIPLVIGEGSDTETVYADYTGQPDGELNTLIFTYVVQEGLADTDGIDIGSAIDLPAGAEITASGVNAPLALPAIATEGILIDSMDPIIVIAQDPLEGTATRGPVTVTVTTYGTGSDIAATKWADGLRTEDYFASGGTLLVTDSFQVTENGTYTIYAEDQVGNRTVVTHAVDNIVSDLPQIASTISPDTATNGPVVISVTAAVYGTSNSLAKLNWLPGRHEVAEFAGGVNGADIMANQTITATANGTYTVYAKDAAGNEAVKEIEITNIVTTAPELTLSYSPMTSTNGTVTVHVSATAVAGEGNTLEKLSWMAGSHDVEDFAGGAAGTDILSAKAFEVTANGIYTVYAKDAAGNEAVEEIEITNIVTAVPAITFSYSPTTSTNGAVTVEVAATAAAGEGNTLEKLSWMAGSREVEDFAGGTGGTDILSAKAFEVTANGIYTVYAKDAAGNEAVKEIEITNIVTAAPELALSYSPTTSTNGTVIVHVAATAAAGEGNVLETLSWMAGSRDVEDFAGGAAGTDILSATAFEVTANGIYTVYAKDAAGNEAVEEIEITNIVTTVPAITLSYSPTTSTNGTVTVQVAATAVAGEGNTLEKLSWMAGSRDVEDFAGGTAGMDILSAKAFEVTANGTYTAYAKDAAGNEAVEEIEITNIVTTAPKLALSYSPTTSTNGTVTVHVSATAAGEGNTLETLSWMARSREVEDFAGGAAGTDILSAKAFEVTANGTYTVYAKDAAGNEAVKEIEITNIVTAEPDDDEDEGTPSNNNWIYEPVSSPGPTITEAPNGGISLVIDSSDIVKETLADGTVIENVVLTDELVEQVLESLGKADKPFATIKIDDSEQAVQVQFPAASFEKAKESYPDAVFEVMLNGSSFQLQISVLDLEGLAEQLGVDLEQMKVNVVIKQVAGQEEEQLKQIAGKQGLKLIGQAVDYKVTVSAGGQTREIRDFGGTYMVRAIVLDDNAGGNQLIAVLYDPAEQALSFVPAVLTTGNEDRKEMSMKVPHNSIYAIMEAPNKSFADLSGHWAKQDVELLASKLIVNGVSDTRFAPDDPITRAEFTALLVRALGIKTEGKLGNTTFQDVSGNVWYAPAIGAGVQAGLVEGISKERFAPNSEITREQMTVMIANALSIAGEPEVAPDRVSHVLEKFSDQSAISPWARSAVAQTVAAGIIHGITEHTMAPSEHATRAQAVVILKQFLEYINFIN